MARLPLPPTKSSLMAVRQQLVVAKDGYELLEQKREILVMELMDMLDEVKVLEQDIRQRLDTAYPALKEMLFKVGRENAWRISRDIRFVYVIQRRRQVVAGIPFAVLETTSPPRDLPYSFSSSSSDCDRTMIEFFELLKLLARMASVRAMVVRLALEVKKTQRRVNALEKMVIPQTRETLVYIENVLEEHERESFFARKLLKGRAHKS